MLSTFTGTSPPPLDVLLRLPANSDRRVRDRAATFIGDDRALLPDTASSSAAI